MIFLTTEVTKLAQCTQRGSLWPLRKPWWPLWLKNLIKRHEVVLQFATRVKSGFQRLSALFLRLSAGTKKIPGPKKKTDIWLWKSFSNITQIVVLRPYPHKKHTMYPPYLKKKKKLPWQCISFAICVMTKKGLKSARALAMQAFPAVGCSEVQMASVAV